MYSKDYLPWGKYGIHGTIYPWFIGKSNASKGCIRMLNKDVKALYKLMPHGTVVCIIQDNRPFRDMKNGDIGSDVKQVQKALKALGYYNGATDGIFGSNLAECIKKYQKTNKIWHSGVMNKTTYKLLMQQYNTLPPEVIVKPIT